MVWKIQQFVHHRSMVLKLIYNGCETKINLHLDEEDMVHG